MRQSTYLSVCWLQLFDKGVEMDVGVQTDLFVDRPATPVYVPAKTGADVATQIYPGDVSPFHVYDVVLRGMDGC